MDENAVPFKGATQLKYRKDKRRTLKEFKKSGIKCTCGILQQFFTALPYWHDEDCIINKNRKV